MVDLCTEDCSELRQIDHLVIIQRIFVLELWKVKLVKVMAVHTHHERSVVVAELNRAWTLIFKVDFPWGLAYKAVVGVREDE